MPSDRTDRVGAHRYRPKYRIEPGLLHGRHEMETGGRGTSACCRSVRRQSSASWSFISGMAFAVEATGEMAIIALGFGILIPRSLRAQGRDWAHPLLARHGFEFGEGELLSGVFEGHLHRHADGHFLRLAPDDVGEHPDSLLSFDNGHRVW